MQYKQPTDGGTNPISDFMHCTSIGMQSCKMSCCEFDNASPFTNLYRLLLARLVRSTVYMYICFECFDVADIPIYSIYSTIKTGYLYSGTVMRRLHDPTDRSARPVGPTVVSCERTSVRPISPTGRTNQTCQIHPTGRTNSCIIKTSIQLSGRLSARLCK